LLFGWLSCGLYLQLEREFKVISKAVTSDINGSSSMRTYDRNLRIGKDSNSTIKGNDRDISQGRLMFFIMNHFVSSEHQQYQWKAYPLK